MTHRRIFLFLFLSLFMIFTLYLSGCGKDRDTGPEAEPTAISAVETETPVLEKSKVKKAAKIIEITGEVKIQKESSDDTVPAEKEMPLYLLDIVETMAASYGSIEFSSGGLVSINENTKIQISGSKDVKELSNKSIIENVILTSGAIWAKISEQEKDIKFITEAGVIGIKGTEFVIDVNDERTIISLLEGTIVFIDDANNQIVLSPGDQLIIVPEEAPVINNCSVDELRKTLSESFSELSTLMGYETEKDPLEDSPILEKWQGTWISTDSPDFSGTFRVDFTWDGNHTNASGSITVTGSPEITSGEVSAAQDGNTIVFGLVGSDSLDLTYNASLNDEGNHVTGTFTAITEYGTDKGTFEAAITKGNNKK